jgi:hypothetical protein
MDSNGRLRWFITFILLAAPKKRTVAVRNFTHIQPASLERLPLTRFLKTMLGRVQAQTYRPTGHALVFRIGVDSGKYKMQSDVNRRCIQP